MNDKPTSDQTTKRPTEMAPDEWTAARDRMLARREPVDEFGTWLDGIPPDIKARVSMHDLVRLWRGAKAALGIAP